ncbi:Retron-type RNA-directed DNA polymerase [hydrothermal vent metagenome]|uniref:Retron-type RNA-directed DNA polymerase n=1 Tax=hydrothermal vent metagenome TaxID=652676 RepID=A0A3B1CHS6_9ZZZZ
MNLFEEICSYSNLLSAFDRVEENAGGPGVDNVTIEEFSLSLNETLLSLGKELLDDRYKPDALLKVGIPKDGGRVRWLSIPTVRDRVVQTSAAIVLTPILDREFEECSFAYRKGRSVKKAVTITL